MIYYYIKLWEELFFIYNFKPKEFLKCRNRQVKVYNDKFKYERICRTNLDTCIY